MMPVAPPGAVGTVKELLTDFYLIGLHATLPGGAGCASRLGFTRSERRCWDGEDIAAERISVAMLKF